MQTRNRPSRRGSRNNRRRSYSSSQPRSGGFKRRSFGGPQNRNGRTSTRKLPTFDPTKFINTNPVEVQEEVYKPKHKFSTFGLSGRIVRLVTQQGLQTPSPIQDQIIPEILNGRDVIGLAETGTGKTAAFLLPLIEKTLNEYSRQTLIMTPTRELAIQVEDELKKFSKGLKIYSTVCVGGASIKPQISALRRKNHFIIGTPGRILDLINQRKFNPTKITTVVLDEADRMLDMGFIHDMRSILSVTPEDRETLFFSATMNSDAEKMVHDFLKDPVTISVKKRDVTSSIEQDVVRHASDAKYQTLLELLADPAFERVLIFGAMKHSVEKLAKQLTRDGVKSESIHGNKTHGQRQRSLARFKRGEAQVLTATDVAARGIHVDNVTHVINYDLPNTFEDYVHRIGRTGRGKNRGKALTFVVGG